MKRKNIAVCVTGYNFNYESRVVKGIGDRCAELDINLLIFATLIQRPSLNENRVLPDSVIKGETEIFNLINYDIIDGIIILGDSIIEEKVIFDVYAKASEKNIPVVNVNDPNHKLTGNVLLSDKRAMEFVVRHLVEEHGLTKINFIGGFPGNLQTEERLAAYKKVLEEHNIPVEESRIAYGEFWIKSVDCVKQFLASGDIPQAIVCASDTMAIFCMDYLQENGYRIPEDIVVTGFDGLDDCEVYKPTITSVRRGFETAGRRAVELVEDILNGKKSDLTVEVDSELVIMQSCGCVPKADKRTFDFFSQKYGAETAALEFRTYIHAMNTDFAAVKNSAELFENAKHSAEFFKLDRLFVCICSNIERETAEIDEEEIFSSFRGISDTMVNMFSYGNSAPVGKKFPAAELVPEDILNGDKAAVFAFSPLYFKDNFLGYIAYEPTCYEGNGEHFATWLMVLSNNTGSYYMNKKLELVVEQLENLYVRDPLTGLYNRRGMSKYGVELLDNAKKANSCITVVCSDIDNLKPINDLYGHEAGDNAIVQTARAISKAMPDSAVSVRTGGDEFCSVLQSCSDEEINGILEQIEQTLEDYNASSGLPYKIGCSCGYYSMKAAETESIEKIAAFADEEMYKVKVRKKAMRKM
ncbi:MAG: GGDEF domain-containing protein [Oscillospiraceae bacterium]|nr:GGDEF domain-containing protein [Oscillospiraceae bacterium]MDY6209162.1 GGDEF domain-containing protein [Oscillospiraceae bacterium]